MRKHVPSCVNVLGDIAWPGVLVAGSGGDAGSAGLRHYQVEVAKTSLDRASRRGRFAESLDGNGQLFLCLQDLNLRQMSSDRQRVLIIFTDEEWDINGLKDQMGRLADRSTVLSLNLKKYNIS